MSLEFTWLEARHVDPADCGLCDGDELCEAHSHWRSLPPSVHVSDEFVHRAWEIGERWRNAEDDLWNHLSDNDEHEDDGLTGYLTSAVQGEYLPALWAERRRAIAQVKLAQELLSVAKNARDICSEAIEAAGKRINEDAARAHLAARRKRLAERPIEVAIEQGRTCIRCKRKPARIDDFCKVCARAEGIIVHGKIGEA